MARTSKDDGSLEAPASVYVMVADGRIKIGMARDVGLRHRQMQNGSPARVDLLFHRQFSTRLSAKEVEAKLHRKFARRRMWGEWFSGAPEPVVEALKAISDPNLHIDGWHPDMPAATAQGSTIERYRWHRQNGLVYGQELREQMDRLGSVCP